jgi:hypothetical protein
MLQNLFQSLSAILLEAFFCGIIIEKSDLIFTSIFKAIFREILIGAVVLIGSWLIFKLLFVFTGYFLCIGSGTG